ncbi:hypothetical protein FN846DRAFT_946674 [Sphaerosporella brunnea]|uniref:Uncharacterized protein n=1 Tax=Sphaerosporella brunnea TaxID=1250544 RepID=A0A5J5EZE4_9PEZI|nr:hypothetical protein FN846DRAFT_946674 [Sphaerosporella brunnea]
MSVVTRWRYARSAEEIAAGTGPPVAFAVSPLHRRITATAHTQQFTSVNDGSLIARVRHKSGAYHPYAGMVFAVLEAKRSIDNRTQPQQAGEALAAMQERVRHLAALSQRSIAAQISATTPSMLSMFVVSLEQSHICFSRAQFPREYLRWVMGESPNTSEPAAFLSGEPWDLATTAGRRGAVAVALGLLAVVEREWGKFCEKVE